MALNALEQQALVEINPSKAPPFRLTDHRRLVRAASVVIFVVLWEYFGRQVNPLFLSYPSAIVKACMQLLIAGEFQRQAIRSLHVYAIGLSAALVLGIFLGLLMGRYRLGGDLLDPYVYALDAP